MSYLLNPHRQSYLLNPHRHVKIWLSPNSDVFLPKDYQDLLIGSVLENRNDIFHFFYDSRLLKQHSLEQLKGFCDRYLIRTHDIKNIEPQSEREKKLLMLYRDELCHLKKEVAWNAPPVLYIGQKLFIL